MARHPRRLTIEYASESIADLDEIWDWNAEQYGVDHADRYIAFLKIQSGKLTSAEAPGTPVPTRDGYRYAVIKRRIRGHGHVAVFQIEGSVLRLLRYLHTSQNCKENSPKIRSRAPPAAKSILRKLNEKGRESGLLFCACL